MNKGRGLYYPFNLHPYYQEQVSGQRSKQHPIPNNVPQYPLTPYENFAKPPQPNHWNAFYQQHPGAPYPNVKTGQSWGQASKGVMSYFQDKNGQLDIDKMLNTVGQMANTYHQVSPIVKGIGSFIKGIK